MSKVKVLLCSALLFSVSPMSYSADPNNLSEQQGLITFTGALTSETCEIDGIKNITVELPKLSVDTFKVAGTEAGSRDFTISVKNCSATLKSIAAHFEAVGGSEKDTVTGNLKNTLQGGANIQVRLYKGQKQVKVGETSELFPLVGNAAKMTFAGGYYSTGAATAGAVEAKAIYTIAYP